MSKIPAIIIIFFLIGLGAFRLGLWISSSDTEPNPLDLAKNQSRNHPHNAPTPRSTPTPTPTLSNGFRKPSAEDELSKDELHQKYLNLVEDLHLEKKSKDLLAAFPNSDSGRILAYAATFFISGPAGNTPEGAFANEQLKNIRNNPDAAARDLKEGINRLGPEYHHERLFLTQIVSDASIDPQSKMELLSLQFRKTITEQSLSESEITFRIMTEVLDPSSLEPFLRETLSTSANTMLNSTLIAVFEKRYPEQAKQMKQNLGL